MLLLTRASAIGDVTTIRRLRARTKIPEGFTRNKAAVIGLVITSAYITVSMAAPLLPLRDPLQMSPAHRLESFNRTYLLGTDSFGRDILSRLIFGARVSLCIAVFSVGLSAAMGTFIGLLTGYLGGDVDSIIMRVMDILFAFPVLLLALLIVTMLGASSENVVIAIAVVYTPIFARLIRSATLAIKAKEFVEASKCIGAGSGWIIRFHIFPNVVTTLVVQTSLALSWAILTEATLSFLGLGTQPPMPSLGRMVYEGKGFMEMAPWLAVAPGAAVMLGIIGFNLLGDGLRDLLDPRLRV